MRGKSNNRFKLTANEKGWILYDVGNSAFILMVSTILPIYFNYLAENAGISDVDYLAYWGYAASIVTLIVAVLGPVLGTLADTKGFKKPIFTGCVVAGCLSCIAMGVTSWWISFLVVFIIAKVCFSSSLVFYDSMLSDVTTDERMDIVSSNGYAYGYAGSCIPFLISLIFVLGYNKLGISLNAAMLISFVIVAVWWFLMTVPLIKHYKQINYVERKPHAVKESFVRIKDTLCGVVKQKKIFLFLVAFFFYIDGVYTIIDMATAYGSALGLNSTGLLLALLVTQLVAFPFAIIFGRLTSKYSTGRLITACIIAYIGITVFAIFMKSQWQFWVLAIFVGMFQGGIQALSRSYFAKIIPAERSGEYFGLMDICGKGASFLGTLVVGAASQIFGSINIGVSMIVLLFTAGLVLFIMTDKLDSKEADLDIENGMIANNSFAEGKAVNN